MNFLRSSLLLSVVFCAISSYYVVLAGHDPEKVPEMLKKLCELEEEKRNKIVDVWTCVEKNEGFEKYREIQQKCIADTPLKDKEVKDRIEVICADVDEGVKVVKEVVECEEAKRKEEGVEVDKKHVMEMIKECGGDPEKFMEGE